jgi:[ribosomal protein S5]-alanine N-acetyltransferase
VSTTAGVSLDGLQLCTARLLLRPPQASDASALLQAFSDAQAMRYWSTPPWTSLNEAERFIQRSLQSLASGEALRLILVRTADARVLGQCTLFSIDRGCRRAEIGYLLDRSVWGQGYMQEALHALIAHGFGTMGLNRIEADIDPRNARSARSLERLGFQREGLLRERWIVGNERCDSALYGLLASEWRHAA